MAQTSINVRIDEDLKAKYSNLCDSVGMKHSTAI